MAELSPEGGIFCAARICPDGVGVRRFPISPSIKQEDCITRKRKFPSLDYNR